VTRPEKPREEPDTRRRFSKDNAVEESRQEAQADSGSQVFGLELRGWPGHRTPPQARGRDSRRNHWEPEFGVARRWRRVGPNQPPAADLESRRGFSERTRQENARFVKSLLPRWWRWSGWEYCSWQPWFRTFCRAARRGGRQASRRPERGRPDTELQAPAPAIPGADVRASSQPSRH
jgi:hypothetical protein